jgi:NADH-quinone oxidoreductase subunit N
MSNTDSLIAILPILIVIVTGIVVLVCDACIPLWRRLHVLSGNVTLIGIVIAAYFSITHLSAGADHTNAFNGAIKTDNFAQACNLILLVSAGLASLMALTYLENRRLNLGEYYALILFATAGAMLMAAASDLIVLFIAIETLSVALYVLAGFARTDLRSEEAALKYFLLGAFAAGFLLYGIALIYGGTGSLQPGFGGSTNLDILARNVALVGPNIMLMAGVALVLVGLGFKAALVPFHMWTPDVYEGAPTSVTAFMAASAKVGAFAAILRVFNALGPISAYWMTAVQVLAVLTMFGGNLLAVTQDNVKRMLAYSSIAHAGYLMVAVAATANAKAHDQAFGAAVFYLLAYTLMTMGAFAVLIYLSRRGKDYQTLNDLKGLAKTDPPSAYLMLVFMLSLGGIPPTMGFIGKWYIFAATITAGQYGLAIALAFASMISIYYYLRVVWMMCFQEPDVVGSQEHAVAPVGVQLSLFVTVGVSLLCGVVPGIVQPLMVAVQTVMH